MSNRNTPIAKIPAEILEDVFTGHDAAGCGTEKGMKYLLKFIERFNSIPNAVKFFIYDLLAEDAYQSKNTEICRDSAAKALYYLPEAQTEASKSYKDYFKNIRCFERSINLAVNDGDFEKALLFCEQATALGLGKEYAAKKNSIERMI